MRCTARIRRHSRFVKRRNGGNGSSMSGRRSTTSGPLWSRPAVRPCRRAVRSRPIPVRAPETGERAGKPLDATAHPNSRPQMTSNAVRRTPARATHRPEPDSKRRVQNTTNLRIRGMRACAGQKSHRRTNSTPFTTHLSIHTPCPAHTIGRADTRPDKGRPPPTPSQNSTVGYLRRNTRQYKAARDEGVRSTRRCTGAPRYRRPA